MGIISLFSYQGPKYEKAFQKVQARFGKLNGNPNPSDQTRDKLVANWLDGKQNPTNHLNLLRYDFKLLASQRESLGSGLQNGEKGYLVNEFDRLEQEIIDLVEKEETNQGVYWTTASSFQERLNSSKYSGSESDLHQIRAKIGLNLKKLPLENLSYNELLTYIQALENAIPKKSDASFSSRLILKCKNAIARSTPDSPVDRRQLAALGVLGACVCIPSAVYAGFFKFCSDFALNESSSKSYNLRQISWQTGSALAAGLLITPWAGAAVVSGSVASYYAKKKITTAVAVNEGIKWYANPCIQVLEQTKDALVSPTKLPAFTWNAVKATTSLLIDGLANKRWMQAAVLVGTVVMPAFILATAFSIPGLIAAHGAIGLVVGTQALLIETLLLCVAFFISTANHQNMKKRENRDLLENLDPDPEQRQIGTLKLFLELQKELSGKDGVSHSRFAKLVRENIPSLHCYSPGELADGLRKV